MEPQRPAKLPKRRTLAPPPSGRTHPARTHAKPKRRSSGFGRGIKIGIGIGVGLLLLVAIFYAVMIGGYFAVESRQRPKVLVQEVFEQVGIVKQQLEMWHMEYPQAAVPPDWETWAKAYGRPNNLFPTDHFENCLFLNASFDQASGHYVGTIKCVNKKGSEHLLIDFFADGTGTPFRFEEAPDA